MCSVLSAKRIAATKVAIIVCNHPEIKREILCAPGSEYNRIKCNYSQDRKRLWDDIIERKTSLILEDLCLGKPLRDDVISTAFLVGIRMLIWAYYHERYISLQREDCINFLSSSFFTPLGIINNKKVGENLMNYEHLDIDQKFKVACLNCFKDDISALYIKMTEEECGMYYDAENPNIIRQEEIVKFWAYYLKGDIDKLRGNKTIGQYFLEVAVNSASQAAVVYYLENAYLRNNSNAIVAAAVETVQNLRIIEDEYYVFYDVNQYFFVPKEYHADILYFLLLKMNEDEKTEFLKKNIRFEYMHRFDVDRRYKVLEYFLSWPYQNYFMELAKRMIGTSQQENFDFPVEQYGTMLLKICDQIDPKYPCINYGEGETWNYRVLLQEFWNHSHERFKRYVFSDPNVDNRNEGLVEFTCGAQLLIRLLTIKKFTTLDKENIKLIVASANDTEMDRIIFSKVWISFYVNLIKKGEWEKVYSVELNGSLSTEKINSFKKAVCFTEDAQDVFTSFAVAGKWSAAENLITWSALTDEDIKKLKKEIIYSTNGRDACVDIIIHCKNVEAFEEFVRWCFTSDEDRKAFKKEFVCNTQVIFVCLTSFDRHKLNFNDFFNEIIYSCHSSEDDVKRFKKEMAYSAGLTICDMLITDEPMKFCYAYRSTTSPSSQFKGGNWKKIEQFLSWCFSSEEDISEFKKNKFFNELGKKVHFSLIKSKQWDEAKHFFSWVGLSDEEVRELKKETLFNYDEALITIYYLIRCDDIYHRYESEQESAELYLKWFLKDKESLIEFKDVFKSRFHGHLREKREAYLFEKFDLVIEQCVSDLEKGIQNQKE